MPNLPGGWELVLILVVVMVVFGSSRLPGAARSLGQSLRIFKAETKGLKDDYRDGLDGKDDAAVRRGEIVAEGSTVGTPAQVNRETESVLADDLRRREEELRLREEALRRRESETR
jgi:sec-independent protein translocase protein TatA